MSDDRLEKALQEMRQEDVDAATLEAARGRVFDNLANAGSDSCAEFRPDFPHTWPGGSPAAGAR